MEYKFHLVFVKHIAIDEDSNTTTPKSETDVPKKYLKVQSMIEFDTFTATHGPGTYVDGMCFPFFAFLISAKPN